MIVKIDPGRELAGEVAGGKSALILQGTERDRLLSQSQEVIPWTGREEVHW